MKTCPECGRNYSAEAVVCAYDGNPLSSGTTGSWARPSSIAPMIGDVLGPYRILGEIAEGGMGVVFKAEHVRLGRKVALKVLKPELAQRTDVIQRFFEEARAVNEIHHPHIVDIIDFVEVADRDPPLIYTVMEFLEGEDLAMHLRRVGPMNPPDVLQIADEVADALSAVHRVKILHRDLKPENIFLAKHDGGHKVKLLDFGVARSFGARQRLNMTDPGTAIGTPEYMAPEQVLGRDLDERTDLYALGLVLYAMLTGATPFASSRLGEMMIQQVKQLPEPIAMRRKAGSAVPAALEAMVMKCLEKEPAARFQDMRSFREALLASLSGFTSATPPEPAPRASTTAGNDAPREAQRSPRPLVVFALMGLVSVGVAIPLALWSRHDKPASQAPRKLARSLAPPRTAAAAATTVEIPPARLPALTGDDGRERANTSASPVNAAAPRAHPRAQGTKKIRSRRSLRVRKTKASTAARTRRPKDSGTLNPFDRF